ncbi:YeeE/YedE thiosulfate transporter family protein [Carboxydothermus pertinax]|uniref:Uncharacterized protein n=1 Tax=Carboxydothermus pertinax TaxID=870242 RepID=A0A1L8CTE5_9THEO|nr:YeeE/YedE thiosulfate transporter family protein [Carboxydothermus pertinax]GAV22177.1 hypothetical protein cpu_06870 [Carboxydothermus pertinax]
MQKKAAYGLLILFLSVLLFLVYQNLFTQAAVFALGLGFGYAVSRSRFCFASAFRDLIMFRDKAMSRGVTVLIAVSAAGFFVIQLLAVLGGHAPPGKINPVGWHLVIGGIIFGVGMVLAGGCVISTLVRVGEGFFHYWGVLLGIVIGSVLGAFGYGFWKDSLTAAKKFWLPGIIGWIPTLLIYVIVFFFLFKALQEER